MSDTNETSDNEAEKLRAQIEALKSKNQELIREKQAAKAAAEQAAEAAEEAKTDAAAKSGDVEAIKAAHAKELTKAQQKLAEYDAKLRAVMVDNAISQTLAASNIIPEHIEVLTAFLKSKADFKDGVATIGDEPITDHIKSFLSSDAGAHYVRPANNNGGGATGNNGSKAAMFTRDDILGRRSQEFQRFAAQNTSEANALLDELGLSELKS